MPLTGPSASLDGSDLENIRGSSPVQRKCITQITIDATKCFGTKVVVDFSPQNQLLCPEGEARGGVVDTRQ
jgi:hypothetical protein